MQHRLGLQVRPRTESLSAICAMRAVVEDGDMRNPLLSMAAAIRVRSGVTLSPSPGEEGEALLVALGDTIEFEHGSPTFYRHGQWPRATRQAP